MSKETFSALSPEGGWTKNFGFDFSFVSYEDTISPEFFALEREAIFRPAWHYVGRVNHLRKPGCYFTREIPILNVSILVTLNDDYEVRVFYNVCPHRGNKLVWDTYADREISGHCKRFFCKFHGIQYDTDGKVAVLTDQEAWSGNQGHDLKLAAIPFEIWNGFIFVNVDPRGPQQTLKEFIGDYYWDQCDYPYELCTERYFFRRGAQANWKTMKDGFAEVYHAPATHAKTFNTGPSEHLVYPTDYFDVHGWHQQFVHRTVKKPVYAYKYEEKTSAMSTGPWYEGYPEELKQLPQALNPTGMKNWGASVQKMWPNFDLQFYNPGYFLTFLYIPIAVNQMRLEVEMWMPEPKKYSERLAQQASVSMFLEAALQDFSLIEATQVGLQNQAFDSYPLTDEEICVRAFHKDVARVTEEFLKNHA